MNPITDTWRGLLAFPAGWRWLLAHKKYLALLLVPMFLGVGAAVGALSFFIANSVQIFGWILPVAPDVWYWMALYGAAKALLWLALLLVCLIVALLIVSVVSAPIYEVVSVAIERDVTGRAVQELSISASLRLIGEELKKAFFIISLTILLLFIPGLNVISTLIAAFLIGWDFYDYPLARRGWKFRQRLGFVVKDFWAVLGLGLWLVIPIVHIVLMPLAVAGGTLLNLRALEKSNRLREHDLLCQKET